MFVERSAEKIQFQDGPQGLLRSPTSTSTAWLSKLLVPGFGE